MLMNSVLVAYMCMVIVTVISDYYIIDKRDLKYERLMDICFIYLLYVPRENTFYIFILQ